MLTIKGHTIYKRYFIAFLACLGYMNMYCLRTNITVALVEMTSVKTVQLENGTYTRTAEYTWDSDETAVILSIFSYGYMATILGGIIATKYGGATVFGAGIAIAAVLTLFTPLLLRLNLNLFLISKFLQGIFEAASFSSIPEVWSRWSPLEERSRLMSYSFTGIYAGLTISYPISGFVASIWNWQGIFYVTGSLALIWSVVWLSIVKNDPSEDEKLYEKERLYLQKNVNTVERNKIKYPWLSVLTSRPVWALCVVQFFFSCGYTVIITYLPTYIKHITNTDHDINKKCMISATIHHNCTSDINNTDINKIGMISALPHLFAALSHPIAGYLADVLRSRNILTPTQIHKIYICVGFFIGSILLHVIVYQPNFYAIITSLCLFRLFTSFSDFAFHVNVTDLAPELSSFLLGITTLFFTLGSMVGPIIIAKVAKNNTHKEWNVCFIIFSTIYLYGATLYFYFGSGKLQWWSQQYKKSKYQEPSEERESEIFLQG